MYFKQYDASLARHIAFYQITVDVNDRDAEKNTFCQIIAEKNTFCQITLEMNAFFQILIANLFKNQSQFRFHFFTQDRAWCVESICEIKKIRAKMKKYVLSDHGSNVNVKLCN